MCHFIIRPPPQQQYVQQYQTPKYVSQSPIPVPAQYMPAQNFINSIKPAPTLPPKPTQQVYQHRLPIAQQQHFYETKPVSAYKNQIAYQLSTINQHQHRDDYRPSPEQMETIAHKEVPYFQPQSQSLSSPKHIHSTTYRPISSTTVTPLYRVSPTTTPAPTTYQSTIPRNTPIIYRTLSTPSPQYQAISSTPKTTQYLYSTSSPPIQHLTETTQTLRPSTKPYFYQSPNVPIHVKTIPRYESIIKPSPPPKILISTIKPSYPQLEASSLAEVLKKLQQSNHLPHTLTPDNIDNSIKTLVRILNDLKRNQKVVNTPPDDHQDVNDVNEVDDGDDNDRPVPGNNNGFKESDGDDYYDTDPVKDDVTNLPGPNTGRPGIDYPALAEIPQTSFSCKEQRYKGFFGDPETNCQVWHYCDLNGGKASFLCPNGTIFSQVALTCDWWFNVKCSSTAQLYVLNERLYKYILPFTPKFPEDYSGPLVDK